MSERKLPPPLDEVCPCCDGSGKRPTTSFSTPSKLIERSCSLCKGKGRVPITWYALKDKFLSLWEVKNEFVGALKAAEQRLTELYCTITPLANYRDGKDNRFADEDDTVKLVRDVLSKHGIERNQSNG